MSNKGFLFLISNLNAPWLISIPFHFFLKLQVLDYLVFHFLQA